MTNRMHNLVFKIYDMAEEKYSRNWFYYIIFVWMVFLIIGAFVVLLKSFIFLLIPEGNFSLLTISLVLICVSVRV